MEQRWQIVSSQPIHLGEEQERKARELAQEDGTSTSEVANSAIDRLYEQRRSRTRANGKRSLYDALLASGSLGHATGGPTDLSTNPEHLKGFGDADTTRVSPVR